MEKYELKVKLLSEYARLPEYAHVGDAGLDLFSCEEVTLEPFERKLIKTGISIELPKNTEAQVRPRSGLALKNGITVLNTPGTIDEGYRGEIGIILINFDKSSFTVTRGMKIAQMIVKPIIPVEVKEIDVLNTTERGTGGFGSTGI